MMMPSFRRDYNMAVNDAIHRTETIMPRHLHFVEPVAGGMAVLPARDPADPPLWLPPHRGASEVANDLDGRVVNFWRVLGVRTPSLADDPMGVCVGMHLGNARERACGACWPGTTG
jgi:hypothetical protein